MQLELMHDSINDALAFIVSATGGAKKVGAEMRPELSVDAAASWIKDCLNPNRRERFNPEQVIFLLRRGRQAGVHCGMEYIARETGYNAEPIEPEDERAQLQRDFTNAVKVLEKITTRMDRLDMKGLRSVA